MPELIFSRDHLPLGAQRRIERAADAGVLTRVRRGAYVETAQWDRLAPDARHRVLVHATAAMARHPFVAAYLSAGAMQHLPTIGDWPGRVHVVDVNQRGGRSSSGIVRHSTSVVPDCTEIDGIMVTSAARTVADIARSSTLDRAVVAADAALRRGMLSRDDLRHQIDLLGSGPGCRQAAFVCDFADAGSANGGESLARLLMRKLGFASPRLQTHFTDEHGSMFVDFFWPELGLVVEFDGFQKYSGPEYLRGRVPAEVVWEEKRREDRLRALGLRVLRIVWSDLTTPGALAHILATAGVPRRVRP